ncbi:beclin 1-associated autophagy-related key regulator [Achroia grisella]|uniref:beclin 1-associated autophagy-related key regulator n=1 Tax=Achroia grisella TaxID=688607 RepID=UPI0027D24E03|nr:beclin 1-associated autophagy-related key regulator [Achroia grisella]
MRRTEDIVMALSYLSEGDAPRDFRVSSTESHGHYTKCLLCYTVKRNFYCAECINTGNFVHSSMPHADRFSEKQGKLLRLKVNRKHVLDRCEKLLSNKIHKDTLLTEAKLAKDKLNLLKLAIEQRKNNIEEKRKVLTELKQCNNELSLKLPRYQKRVASLESHAQQQQIVLHNKVSLYNEQAESLAALRRSRIRQLNKYIFPVYLSYDMSDSIEDMEFVGEDAEEVDPKRSQLHIGAPWINTDGDFTAIQSWVSQHKEAPALHAAHRATAALSLAAQLAALLAWTLDARLPQPIVLSEYCNWRVYGGGARWRTRRLRAACGALCTRAAIAPSAALEPARALAALHALAVAAAADHAQLGRVETWASEEVLSAGEAWAGAWAAPDDGDDCDPPEHLHWPEPAEMEELSSTPPAPAPSLVTSAAASLASMWRGWTK